MLGCFDLPYHTSAADWFAHPGQASQYLWATLDQRGFSGEAEAKDWTLFLKRMGALPIWDRYRAVTLTITDEPPTSAQAAEARASFYPPFVRLGWAANQSETPDHVFQARALYWAGLPPEGGPWAWLDSTLPGSSADDVSSYRLWDGSGPFDQGAFMAAVKPLIAQNDYWIDFPARTGRGGAMPVPRPVLGRG